MDDISLMTERDEAEEATLYSRAIEKWETVILAGATPLLFLVRSEELPQLLEEAGVSCAEDALAVFRGTPIKGVEPGDVFTFGHYFIVREEDMDRFVEAAGEMLSGAQVVPLAPETCWLIGTRPGVIGVSD